MKYGKAPIVEAILDIRVSPRPDASAAELVSVFSGLDVPFTKREEIAAEQHIKFTFGPSGPAPNVGPVLGGFRYEYSEQSQVVQAQREGFVFSLLPPYSEWEDFAARARTFWEHYQKSWQPRQITRLALRYVNQFDFPVGQAGFKYTDYFTIMPGNLRGDLVPPPQALDGFSLQMLLPQADIEAMAILNFGSLPRVAQAPISIVLDIDIFCERLAVAPQNEDALWATLEKLRHRKNDLFRACLTTTLEKALEPMEDNQ